MNSTPAAVTPTALWTTHAPEVLLLAAVILGLIFLAWRSFRNHKNVKTNVNTLEKRVDEILQQLSNATQRGDEKNPPPHLRSTPFRRDPAMDQEEEKDISKSAAKRPASAPLISVKPQETKAEKKPQMVETHVVRCSSCGNNVIYRKAGRGSVANCPNCGKPLTLH